MATKLTDIAASTGFSVAAVSMAINGKPGVSESTRAVILAEADRLGYRPNQSGRALRLSRVGSIGIYTPASLMEYPLYYGEITRGVVAGLADSGYSPVMLPSASETGDLRDLPAVDGYILVEPHSDDLGTHEILRGEAATVCIDPAPPGSAEPWGVVESDTRTSTTEALDIMVARGSERPGLLTVETVSQWTVSIEARYREWCAERGIPPEVVRLDPGEGNGSLRQKLAAAIGEHAESCDGLFICGDSIAVRIAGVLRSLGYVVGEDVKLVSGVDSTMMEYHTPPITSVDLSPLVFGQRAARMMLELLELPERPSAMRREVLPAPLVPRAT
ncbi:LacI family DNA-binding transcriptional regulator [Leucobacter chironomi]|uniref:LacI family DNA-binding transcriptional regulator n=1 Tax=Leucobacter chironomi TaxID=491918 RepID=UPI0004193537|nr:LacI family DNA-binding transcriptional regulator [Leucobacter chironomi]